MFLRRYRKRSYAECRDTSATFHPEASSYIVSRCRFRAIYPSRVTYSYYSLAYQAVSRGRHNNTRHFNPSPTRTAIRRRRGRKRCRARPRVCAESFFCGSRANHRYSDIKFRWIVNGGTATTRSRSDLNLDLTGRVIFRSPERRYKPRP